MSAHGNYIYACAFTTDSTFTNKTLCNVFKLDLNGDTIWVIGENIDSSLQQVPFVVLSDDSGVYMGASVKTAAGNYKITVIKYDQNGGRLWRNDMDTTLPALPVAMALSGSYVAITGFEYDNLGNSNFLTYHVNRHTGIGETPKLTANGVGAISHPCGLATDTLTRNYIAGTSTVSGINSVIKLIAYDSAFNLLYENTWGDSSKPNQATSMCVDNAQSHIYVTGSSPNASGGTDLVVLKFNTVDGSLAWSRRLSAPNPANGTGGVSITSGQDLSAYVTGWVFNGVDTNVITAAIDSGGNLLWSKTYARTFTSTDVPYSISMGDDGMTVNVTARSIGPDSQYVMLSYKQWIPTPCGDSVCPSISYVFKNGQITASGIDSFIEFDIYAKQNIDTLPFSGGNIIFTYSNAVFGNGVVDSNNIIVTRGTILQDSNAYAISLYDTLLKSDVVPINGSEVWLSVSAIDTPIFVIADTPQQLCHVKMKLKHTGNFGIDFDQFFMQNQSYYSNFDITPYSMIYTGVPLSPAATSCTPPTLTYTIVNQGCGMSATGPVTYFDVEFSTTVPSYPIADIGFILTWNNTIATFSSSTITSQGLAMVNANYSTSTSCNSGTSIYNTPVDIAYVDGTGSIGYYQFQLNYAPGCYDPTVNEMPNFPTSSARTIVHIVLNVPTLGTYLTIGYDMTNTGSSGTNIVNDFACINAGSSGPAYTITTFGTGDVVTNKTNQTTQIECLEGGLSAISGINNWSHVFPNPFSNDISVEYSVSELAEVSIKLEDVLGRELYKKDMGLIASGFHNNLVHLPVNIPTGGYMLKLKIGKEERTIKIVKE